MKILKIEWHRTFDEYGEGYMKLILDKFFPCTTEKANKVFGLVGEWCPDETIAELEGYFAEKIETIERQIAEIKHIYLSTSVGSYEKKKCETDFKRLQTLLKKYNRMVKLLHTHTHTHTYTRMKGSDKSVFFQRLCDDREQKMH